MVNLRPVITLATLLLASTPAVAQNTVSENPDLNGKWVFDFDASKAAIIEKFDEKTAEIGAGFLRGSSVSIDLEESSITYMLSGDVLVGTCKIDAVKADTLALTGCSDAVGEPAQPIEFGIPHLSKDGLMSLEGREGHMMHYKQAQEG